MSFCLVAVSCYCILVDVASYLAAVIVLILLLKYWADLNCFLTLKHSHLSLQIILMKSNG